MLEEILKNINSNLERIANSLEIKEMKGMIEEEPCIQAYAGIPNQVITNGVGASTVKVPIMQTQNNASIENTQVPVQQTIPTSANQESFTMEQLAVAMSNAVSAGKMNVIQEILQQFGVQALTQINPADYNKVATLLKEKGLKV